MTADVTEIRLAEPHELDSLIDLRLGVFGAQGFDPQFERDATDDDPRTVHAIAVDDAGTVIGTARMMGPGEDGSFHGESTMATDTVHIGRVAVSDAARGTGAGTGLMRLLHREALRRWGVDGQVVVEVSAQEQALGFYHRLGYDHRGDPYLDEGVVHYDAAVVVRVD